MLDIFLLRAIIKQEMLIFLKYINMLTAVIMQQKE